MPLIPNFTPNKQTTAIGNMGQTEAEIAKAVAAEIEAEIAGQVSPLEDLIRQQREGEAGAVEKLNQLYGSIQPSVQNATANLQANFDTSKSFEKGIFDASQARIQGVRAQAGAQAQALSQQLGVSIPVSLFDMGALTEQGLGAAEGAGAMLSHSGMRDAALAEAEAFSGRVFPLMRTEAERDTRRHYASQITSIEKEIAALRKMKPGLINQRTRERLLEERGYQLERAKAQRDWELAKFSSKLETSKVKEARAARLAADKLQRNAQKAQATAAAAGEATTRRGQTLQAKAEKARLAAQKAESRAKKTEYEAAKTTATRENISKFLQAAIAGQSADVKRIVQNPTTGDFKSVTETVQTPGIQNPNQLLSALRAAVPGARGMEKFAMQQVSSALHGVGIEMPKNWVEGQAAGSPTTKNPKGNASGTILSLPTRKTMSGMPLPQLETVARQQLGFRGGYPGKMRTDQSPSGVRKRKQWLINWIARREVEEGGDRQFGRNT